MTSGSNRRDFLKVAGASAAACATITPGRALALDRAEPAAAAVPFTLGMASYTLRSFPTDQAIEMTKRLGLTRICFKDFHLKLDATPDLIADTVAKVKAAGLDLYAGGVIYMKSEAEVDRAFVYAKAAGFKMIIGVPTYELLPYTNRKVQEYDIPVAIHNHGPDNPLFPTPQSAYERIASLDRRLGLCMDVGHTQRSGVDPSESAEKYFDRLFDIHIKDTSASTAQGQTVEIGRGVIDIPKLLRTLTRLGFKGTLALEYEKDAKDPLPGSAESIGYLRGVLAALA
ncbi:MAG: sugar phosphate isomerase/epimerase [Vicinamibacterales bacterium]|nr:sugar phosphate isomerase/epimerase [Vicinamibacterales bacterium]